MAAVIGDFIPDLSRFHSMISGSSSIENKKPQNISHETCSYRSSSRSRLSSSTPRSQHQDAAAINATTSPSPCSGRNPNSSSNLRPSPDHNDSDSDDQRGRKPTHQAQVPAGEREGLAHASASIVDGASQFPSPPPSSSPVSADGFAADDGKGSSMDPNNRDAVSSVGTTDQAPAADAPQEPEQEIVHVRDLAHIESLARADALAGGNGILHDPPLHQVKYEISGMPIGDVIEMVAALLTKITSTNDLQHDAMQRNATHQQQANQTADSNGGSQLSPLNHSVLAFHGRNVPAITILSYLSRIHKYCPTTYEVFLSLLVYFDRMTERVNDMVMVADEARQEATTTARTPQQDRDMSDVMAVECDSDLADDDDAGNGDNQAAPGNGNGNGNVAAQAHSSVSSATYFVVDSFNIHRLIIAGVTCSSKFFSDVFYTNSRYAKVGGLPLSELNHLELQFLVLNDFRLAVPVEDLEAYATMLVEFYAREVVAPKAGLLN